MGSVSDAHEIVVRNSFPSDAGTWSVTAISDSTGGDKSFAIRAYALCVVANRGAAPRRDQATVCACASERCKRQLAAQRPWRGLDAPAVERCSRLWTVRSSPESVSWLDPDG